MLNISMDVSFNNIFIKSGNMIKSLISANVRLRKAINNFQNMEFLKNTGWNIIPSVILACIA